MKKTWVEMNNGEILAAIPFVLWISRTDRSDVQKEFTAPNPPIHHGDSDLFKRLSFDYIKQVFADLGCNVSHIIRGESSENGCRDCYVYSGDSRVPFAVIRPAVFAGHKGASVAVGKVRS